VHYGNKYKNVLKEKKRKHLADSFTNSMTAQRRVLFQFISSITSVLMLD